MEPIWKWKFCHLARQLHSTFNLAREGWTCQDHLGGCSEDYHDALLSFTLQHHREQTLHFKAAVMINFWGGRGGSSQHCQKHVSSPHIFSVRQQSKAENTRTPVSPGCLQTCCMPKSETRSNGSRGIRTHWSADAKAFVVGEALLGFQGCLHLCPSVCLKCSRGQFPSGLDHISAF